MSVLEETLIYRLVHVANLTILLRRGGLCAPLHEPSDGMVYKKIHNAEIQNHRQVKPIPCRPGGKIHDYVPFYFCTRSPMLYILSKGGVEGYSEGQEPLIYLVTTAQKVAENGIPFVFSDGHGIASFTEWFCDLADLNKIDWEVIQSRYWADTLEDGDRKRRKQAEFLIHRFCPWSLILGIAVLNDKMKNQVEAILTRFPGEMRKKVVIKKDWYY
jgi:hypothetical protein